MLDTLRVYEPNLCYLGGCSFPAPVEAEAILEVEAGGGGVESRPRPLLVTSMSRVGR